ncbi:MAG: hypothetical protein V1807_02835 [Patescibacteria group bacterium]
MKDGKSCMHIFDDWFYILLLLLVGFVLLGVNLGLVGGYIINFWPILLILIALKELLDRR